MRLLKVITTDVQTVFQVKTSTQIGAQAVEQCMTFFANNEQSDKFGPLEPFPAQIKHNKNSLFDSKGNVYYNMYAVKHAFFKSCQRKQPAAKSDGTTYDYHNIFCHKLSSDISSIVNVDNTIYMLEEKSTYGRYCLDCDIYSWMSTDNNMILPECQQLSTVIYDRSKLSSQIVDLYNGKISKIDISSAISCILPGIQYNMVYEINGNTYNDYESGNILANTFKAKNQYDAMYSMLHSGNVFLSAARDYFDIDKCNNQVYLKYRDNCNYSIDYKSDVKLTVSTKYADTDNSINIHSIEMLKSINRVKQQDSHKTNMYSIVLHTDILDQLRNANDKKNSSTKVDVNKLISNIQNEIKSNIKNIAKNIQPAHAQLLSIEII